MKANSKSKLQAKSPSNSVSPPAVEDEDSGDDAVIGRALARSLLVMAIAAAAIGGGLWWLNRPVEQKLKAPSKLEAPTKRELPQLVVPRTPFTDVTAAAGIQFRHYNGGRGEKLLPETMGGGGAVLDFDNDGDQDILFINGCDWPWTKDPVSPTPTMALYANDGSGKFVDVTEKLGLNVSFYGMGVAVGDYDGDGWIDVFISAVGQDRLFHNEAGQKFVDVTKSAGVAGADNEWGTSCCWLDYDNDGDLDLFVGNYVRWNRDIDIAQDFRLVGVGRAFGPPLAFEGTFPYLYRNDGEGRFSDVSQAAGVQVRNPNTDVPMAKTMGVVPFDIDSDGLVDLVVANDTVQNFMFHNQGNGTFREVGLLAGVAVDSQGVARGAMGADMGHFRNDPCLGIVIGNFANEMTALYVAEKEPFQFFDAALATGLGPPTRLSLTFGVLFVDYDLDGRLDILSSNGHLEEDINKVQPTQFYEQPPKLFWNSGPEQSTEFVPVTTEQVGEELGQRMVGRGSVYADFDGDGDLDLLLIACGAAPRLLRNDQALGHHWLRVKLVGKGMNRSALGAVVQAHVGERLLQRDVRATRSYLSQSELPVTFGLGKSESVDKLVIRWPGGAVQEISAPKIEQLLEVKEP
jgi:hypothetical protein